MIIEKCGIEMVIHIGEYKTEVTCHDVLSETFSEEKEKLFNDRDIIAFIKNVERVESRVELTEISTSANEVANFAKITGNDKIITNIITALNMALPYQEKEMIAFGEAREDGEFEMEYADIVDDLHRICTRIKYSDIHNKGIYEISRMIVQEFMETYLTSSTSLPYNKAMHQNWNYEFGDTLSS